MSFRTPARKSVIALALTLPLALAACGNSDDAEDAPLTSTTTAVKSSTKSSEKAPETTETTTKKEEESSKKEEPAPPAPAPAEQEAQPDVPAETLANPVENGLPPVAPQPPVDGGQPAPQEVVDQLHGLVRGIYAQNSLRSFTGYIPQHTCQSILANQPPELANLDLNQIPDIPMTQMVPGWGENNLLGLDNVLLKGDEASALVTVKTPEGEDSSTMRFRKENGTWTFCQS
ncbi:hypothetical protein [Corynebacterium phocae]|uniref:hypothetical protein n=1 Tax=Corynebacterium phocae TaxID=161895 RepID=UPI00123C35BA|nr:hypothetical protein [Corynebacterium phocae]KAA8725412.1 hypothetical protein F4V58_04005 [Corynebacterium phocae]